MRKLFASTLLVAGLAIPAMAATGTGAAASTTQGANDKTIVETAAADRRFTTLVSLVKRAGLADALSGETKLTVFAPTNAAFRKVPRRRCRSSSAIAQCCGACCSTTWSRAT
jgi:uncharacterized surface protein with fasciclin (FAS1) repeats